MAASDQGGTTPSRAIELEAQIAKSEAALAAVQATNAAQRGLGFVIPDASSWIRGQGCAACQRGGMPLYGGALGAHNGLTVDQSSSTGTAYLAARIAAEQNAAPGGYELRFSKGGYSLWGLAGYTHFSGSTQYLAQIRAGVNWMRTAVTGGTYDPRTTGSNLYNTGPYLAAPASSAPYSYPYVFPSDGLAHAGETTYFVPQDHGSAPTTWNWIQTTAPSTRSAWRACASSSRRS